MTRTRRIIVFIILIFLLYVVITSPALAADYVRQAFFLLADAVRSVFTFFGELLR